MTYVELNLPTSLPGTVEFVIRRGVEPLFEDAHWLFTTVIHERIDDVPRRQLQVPIAHLLLATVSGVSTQLFHASGAGTGRRFKDCLERYFPWDLDPPAGVSVSDAAKILYDAFRNPLSHNLGLNSAREPIVKIGQVFPGVENAEQRVEALERLTAKPFSDPCLVVGPDKCVLWLDQFYWGVRLLVERWSQDNDQVELAHERLSRRRLR